MGGNTEYVPKYIGFIYGTDAVPVGIGDVTNRSQSWDDLSSNMSDSVHGNIQISPITLTPSITVDGGDSYTGNSVVFSAHTRSGAAGVYGFPLTGEFASALDDGHYLYHAMLITKLMRNGIVYMPIARVTLADNGSFLPKPEGFELALDWQISFF
jgi:hypothetical protein